MDGAKVTGGVDEKMMMSLSASLSLLLSAEALWLWKLDARRIYEDFGDEDSVSNPEKVLEFALELRMAGIGRLDDIAVSVVSGVVLLETMMSLLLLLFFVLVVVVVVVLVVV